MTDTAEIENEAPETEEVEELEEQQVEGAEEGGEPDPVKELERKFEDKNRAFASERKKRQASERRRIELEERLEALETATKQAKPNPFAVLEDVDIEGDPIGAIEKLAAVAKSIKAQNEQEELTATQQAAQTRERQKLSDVFAIAEEEFTSEKPDYVQARKFFLENLYEEVAAEGYVGDKAVQEAGERFNQVVIRSIRAGRDAPEVVYTLAQKRGFGLDKPGKKLDLLRKSQAAAKSIGNGAGSTGTKELSYGYVASLPPGPAKTAAFQKLRAQELRKEGRG